MSTLTSILRPEGDIVAGLESIYFIPVADVVTIPTAIGGVIEDDLTLLEDTGFRIIECVLESSKHDEQVQEGEPGNTFKLKVSGVIAGLRPEADEQLSAMLAQRFHVVYRDRQKRLRLLERVRFGYDGGTQAKIGSLPGYTFTFYRDAEAPPSYYEGALVVLDAPDLAPTPRRLSVTVSAQTYTTNTPTFTATSVHAGTYQMVVSTTNVSSYAFTINGVTKTLPFTLDIGQILAIAITRSSAGNAASLTLEGYYQ